MNEVSSKRKNVWFCVNLLSKAERRKEWCLPHNLVWADLDTAKPDEINPHPSIVLESSPMRFQALWRCEETLTPEQAEDFSRRLAYKYSLSGSDVSGWDLTQLLRVPFTNNYKYEKEDEYVPEVKILEASDDPIKLEIFEQLEIVDGGMPADPTVEESMPQIDKLPKADNILYRYHVELEKTPFYDLYDYDPKIEDDWSRLLWRIVNICFEVGMNADEVFAIGLGAKCNKYKRDNRPDSYFWREVLKAASSQNTKLMIGEQVKSFTMPELVDPSNRKDNFITDYRQYGEDSTDAVPEYHELVGFTVLSTLLAGNLHLETRQGTVKPNLWGLILGESTLTRKTTAMYLGTRLLQDIDDTAIVATDATVEGIMSRLADRPGRTSLFHRDEITGLFDSMIKKDYLAGMPEVLTQLYDCPPILRRELKKETYTIRDPVFLFLGGGIKDKLFSILTDDFIYSGFIPRFLIVSGNAELERIHWTTAATGPSYEAKQDMLGHLADLRELYCETAIIKIAGQDIEKEVQTEVFLTDEAWKTFQDFERLLTHTAYESPVSNLALPTFVRLAQSCLKMSMLLAAARQKPEDRKIEVVEQDVINSASYIQDWGRYSVELMLNVGRGKSIVLVDKVLFSIQKYPGVSRGNILKWHNLRARDADEILRTLEERGDITVTKEGKGRRLWPIQ